MAIISIEKFIEGLDYNQFKVDDKTSSALFANLKLSEKQLKIFLKLSETNILKFHGRISQECEIN